MVKLVVGNLPPSATNQSLKEIFNDYADLQDYKLISNYGFVYLESEQSANHAVTNLNGIEYRGFQITVDFVGDIKSKRRLPMSGEQGGFNRTNVQPQKRFAPPLVEQRNTNPYNLNFINENRLPENNNTSRTFDMPQDRRYTGQPLLSEARNPNPYNLPFTKPNAGIAKSFEMIPEKRYGPQTFDDYPQPAYGSQPFDDYQKSMYGSQSFEEYPKSMYGSMPHSSGYNVPQNDQFGLSQFYDYTERSLPEEEYFTNVPASKKLKTNALLDDHGYGYVRRRPFDAVEDEFKPYRAAQPNWYEARQVSMRPSFLHGNDEANYYPRAKKVYPQKKSYIDEYEDDGDYSEIDPYPAYLKQYKK